MARGYNHAKHNLLIFFSPVSSKFFITSQEFFVIGFILCLIQMKFVIVIENLERVMKNLEFVTEVGGASLDSRVRSKL